MFWIEYAVMVLFIDTDSCGQFSKFVYILEEADYKVGSRILLGLMIRVILYGANILWSSGSGRLYVKKTCVNGFLYIGTRLCEFIENR